MWVVALHYLLCNRTHPYPVTLLLLAQAIFEPSLFFLLMNTPTFLKHSHPTPIHLWRWNRVFRNVGIYNSDAGELPRRKHTTFRTRRKFEIKKTGIQIPAGKEILYLPQMSGLYLNSLKCLPGLVLLLSLNNSVQQIPSWDIQISSVSQEIPHILWTLTVHAPCSQQPATFPHSKPD